MNSKVLLVVFDKNCNRVLMSSRIRNSKGDCAPKEDSIEDALNEVGIQFKDVNLIHIMDATNQLKEECTSLYIARLNAPDPVAEGCHRHLFWMPVQHLAVCSGLLSGGSQGFEKMIKDYAISLVLDGYVKFPNM